MTKSLFKKVAVAGLLVLLTVGTAVAQTLFFRSDVVRGYDTDVWRVWVPAGDTRVVVDAGSHTDIDLEVVDAATGRTLATDFDATSYCIGDFYRRTSGFIDIRIENLGSSANGYTLTVRQ